MFERLLPETLFVAVLVGGMVITQLVYEPRAETKGRMLLRWAFLVGSAIVVVLAAEQILEILRAGA